MGREVRKVPADWEHPKHRELRYQFQPLLDEDYDEACRKWYAGAELWTRGEHPDQLNDKDSVAKSCAYYHEYFGDIGTYSREEYMGSLIGDRPRTHFQKYETTSEGTPISPIFATEQEAWEYSGNWHDETLRRLWA